MKFKLKIQLGNAGMQTIQDIALAVKDVVDRQLTGFTMEYAEVASESPSPTITSLAGQIMDRQGNTVGKWRIG